MLRDGKKLKDTSQNSLKDTSSVLPTSFDVLDTQKSNSWSIYSISYSKANKLITALYMVTDILEKDEPIRTKLRTLGVEVLSDISKLNQDTLKGLENKINSIMSFLNICIDLNMISQMNFSILIKEFIALNTSIRELNISKGKWIEDFMINTSSSQEVEKNQEFITRNENNSIGHTVYKGQTNISNNKGHNTRIGVQKGSTLMDALSKLKHHQFPTKNISYDNIKVERRQEIINILKDLKMKNNTDGATITDIRNNAKGVLISCGEKTLQRELISMVKDNVLYKKGEKRWSQYFVA